MDNNRETLFRVSRYEVNTVSDEIFKYDPGPGCLVIDRDTDKTYQIPGGFDYLEGVCESASGIVSKRRDSFGVMMPALPSCVVLGALSCLVTAFWCFRNQK